MKLASIDECTGCGACASVCNKGCITMKIGSNGFYYPFIDKNSCVNCGVCSSKCHILNNIEKPKAEKKYYCGWDISEDKRHEGSSGGAFGALAESVIKRGGVVFGAAFSSDTKNLSHLSTEDIPLRFLKKSKYLESNMGYTIRRIWQILKDGREVLFCGTPCQVYGVRRVLGYSCDNLILCDFLCHGVPSQKRFQLYLSELESRYKSPVKNIGFRTKKYGWKTYCIVVDFENGSQYAKLAIEDPYYKDFFSNTNIRPSCYSCNRVSESVADITLGDFWTARKCGIKDDDTGVSMMVCNTPKGINLLETNNSIQHKAICFEDVAYAFRSHNYKHKSTPLNKRFFDGFNTTIKDRVVAMILKNKILRKITYNLK